MFRGLCDHWPRGVECRSPVAEGLETYNACGRCAAEYIRCLALLEAGRRKEGCHAEKPSKFQTPVVAPPKAQNFEAAPHLLQRPRFSVASPEVAAASSFFFGSPRGLKTHELLGECGETGTTAFLSEAERSVAKDSSSSTRDASQTATPRQLSSPENSKTHHAVEPQRAEPAPQQGGRGGSDRAWRGEPTWAEVDAKLAELERARLRLEEERLASSAAAARLQRERLDIAREREELEEARQRHVQSLAEDLTKLEEQRQKLRTSKNRLKAKEQRLQRMAEELSERATQPSRDSASVAESETDAEQAQKAPTSMKPKSEWAARMSVDLTGDGEGPPICEIRELPSAAVEACLRKFFKESSNGSLQAVADHHVSEMCYALEKRTYKRGSYVYEQGDPGSDIFVIESGAVQVLIDHGTVVRVLRAGDIFGERALLHGGNRSASIKCMSHKTVLWAMARRTYEKLSRLKLKASVKRLIEEKHPIFKNLSADDVEGLMAHAALQTMGAGEIVVRQGEPATMFYVIESGRLEVVKDGRAHGRLEHGDCFGETALLRNELRSATVQVAEDGPAELWPIDKAAFMLLTQHRLKATIAAVKKRHPGILQDATDADIESLMASAVFEVYHQGDEIVKQGEPGSVFYVVQTGSMRVLEGGEPRTLLVEGDYFGERALLRDEARTATVRVLSSKAEVWAIDRQHFESVLKHFVKEHDRVERAVTFIGRRKSVKQHPQLPDEADSHDQPSRRRMVNAMRMATLATAKQRVRFSSDDEVVVKYRGKKTM
eukprot:TRINITY_DN24951_c0_g1_i1.p1 TRINITY_DN24951_c0_g1~~TRINITY_DN24951_c0_g1_i1.p1  ORF type:complete len:775 (+),score=171.20 TRINITY_DN24951_c0_g1_i1:123-2447(+)